MNKDTVVLLFLIALLLSGCSSYRDINDTVFTAMTIIDVDEEGSPLVYMECFEANYSQINNAVQGARTVFLGQGETISEAKQRINQTSRHQLSAVYSKILIFTSRAAEQGLEKYVDILVRDQDFLIRPYIFIFDGDPAELLNLKLHQGEFIGVYLEDLFRNSSISDLMRPYKLFDYCNLMASQSKIAVMGVIGISESDVDPYIGIQEAAVIKENKMVDILTEEEYKIYSILDGKSKTTLITIENPENGESKITFVALKTTSHKSIQYDGEVNSLIYYKIKIKMVLTVNETQNSLDLEDEQIQHALEDVVKEKIKKEGLELFEKFKSKGIDLFAAENELYEKYAHYQVSNVVDNTELELDVDVDFVGSSYRQNYNDESSGD